MGGRFICPHPASHWRTYMWLSEKSNNILGEYGGPQRPSRTGDFGEFKRMCRIGIGQKRGRRPGSFDNTFEDVEMEDFQKDSDRFDEEVDNITDKEFMEYLQQLKDQAGKAQSDELMGSSELADDCEEEEEDIQKVNFYLGSESMTDRFEPTGIADGLVDASGPPSIANGFEPPGTADGLMHDMGHGPTAFAGAASELPQKPNPLLASYLRVVHTNGIHDIAMVSCECCGSDNLPSDLLAARLLPTSFDRIKTLFTAQLLDIFRLSNLELKASAYQFYQLLRRLTLPTAPAEVADLYREFRRMSRLWRWMKRLKWGGYGFPNRKANDVKAGELALFCPACPQPGINIPDDWMEDPERQVFQNDFILLHRLSKLAGFINVFLWPTATSKPIMFGKRTRRVMCGCQRGAG